MLGQAIPHDAAQPCRTRPKGAQLREYEGAGLRIRTGIYSLAPINIVVEVGRKRLQGGADKPQEDPDLAVKARRDVAGVGDRHRQIIRIGDVEIDVVSGEQVPVDGSVDTCATQLEWVASDIRHPHPAIRRIGNQFPVGSIADKRLFARQ